MFQLMNKKLRSRQGFTLIELIVVIAIIAILAAVLIPRFTGFTEDARQKSAVSDTRNILLAVEALLAEGEDDSITLLDVEDFAGKDFPGAIDPDPIVSGEATFNYEITIGTTDYVVVVDDGEIDTSFEAPGAAVTGSTSSALS